MSSTNRYPMSTPIAFLLPADQEIGPGDKRILSRLRSDFAVKRDDGTFKWKVPLIAIVTKSTNWTEAL